VAVGENKQGQCNVGAWTGIQQVAAGGLHTVGLKSDGMVVAVGYGDYWGNAGSWSGIQQVAAPIKRTLGLKSGGTVVSTGEVLYGENNLFDWQLNGAISAATQPQADFSLSSVGTSEGFIEVCFTNMSSGGVPPLACAWDFDNDGAIDSSEWQPRHSYREPGTYTVSLSIRDAVGNQHTKIKVNCLTVLSPNGATVETADKQISTEFPSGAIPGASVVTIGRTPPPGLPEVPFTIGDTCFIISALDDSGNKIASLSQSSTITVKYSEADVAAAGGNPDNLVLAYWDEATGKWKALKTSVDTTNMTLSGSTTHLSTWAVLAKTTPVSKGLPPWLWTVIGIAAVLAMGTGTYLVAKRAIKR